LLDALAFHNTTALDAIGAGFDPLRPAIHEGMGDLQVWPEQPWGDRRHVLTNTACFLGLTAAQDAIPAHLALATNITTSRHI
jgi:hypothetical protein